MKNRDSCSRGCLSNGANLVVFVIRPARPLRRGLFFAHHGHVRRQHLDDQIDQAPCLSWSPAPAWTTVYLADALDALRSEGFPVTDDIVAHLTPAQHDHNFYGTYSFDIDAELRREGHRPLRTTA